jgi:hypothetical protein
VSLKFCCRNYQINCFNFYNHHVVVSQDEAGLSERKKQPCFDQLWHGNLQKDSRTMVILLQVGSVEHGGHEVTFQGHFQGLIWISIEEKIHQDKVILVTINIKAGLSIL